MLVFIDSMEWKHLPKAGGIYDQSPDFVEKAKYYMQQKAQAERARAAKDRAKMPRAPSGQGVRRRR